MTYFRNGYQQPLRPELVRLHKDLRVPQHAGEVDQDLGVLETRTGFAQTPAAEVILENLPKYTASKVRATRGERFS